MGDTLIQVAVSLKEVGTFILGHWEWVLTVFIYPIIKGIKKLYNWFKQMNDIRKSLPAMNDKLDMLVKEFTPNGGGSLKDQITRIERRSALTQVIAWQSREDSPNGEFTADEEGNWNRANRTLLKLIDANDYQVLNLGWLGYVREEEEVRERYLLAIQEKRGVSFACHLRRSDDTEWNVTITIEPLRADGKVLGYVGKVVKRN